MTETLIEKTENITLTKNDLQKLLEAYQKLGEVLVVKKTKKVSSVPATLYGIWEGAEVEEKDFEQAKKSLFQTSL